MPRTVESAFNIELAKVLRGKHPRWRDRIGAEQTGVLQDAPSDRPDIVIRHAGGLTVIVEAEYEPAHTVESEAIDRMGRVLQGTGDIVEQTIAVIVPDELRQAPQERLPELIAEAEFRYCGFSGEAADTRWPTSGWLSGGVDDLAGFIEQTALSERRIKEGTRILEEGVAQAAGRLRDDLQHDYPDVLTKIATALHQEDGEQTSRMAMAIVTNALTFHTAVAGTRDIPTLYELRGPSGTLDKDPVLSAWDRIMSEINYFPVFSIARAVLLPLPDRVARIVLDRLATVASQLDGLSVTTVHDLSGQMFGRLIEDRKLLASFYTLPASATLLAELAVSQLDVDWQNSEAVKALRIADLACGAGTLLSAAYRAVAVRYRHTGGDDKELHRSMIEEVLIGADIMPAATHLTTSMLSSAHPTTTFGHTRIHTMPYGAQEEIGGSTAIGSLGLIASDQLPSLFGTGEHVLHGGEGAVKADTGDEIYLPRDSLDLVIMNPPFTSPTNHAGQYEAPVPSFAGLATSEDEQRKMKQALKYIYSSPKRPALRVGDGNAGLASNFVDLAHAKVKPGGSLAVVLPLAVAAGKSWAKMRQLLARAYRNVTVVTISATGQYERSFSDDTSMGEALVLAVKRDDPGEDSEAEADALYLNLRQRPRSIVEASELARVATHLPKTSRGFLRIGDETVGCFIRSTIAEGGCASLRESDVATAAISLSSAELSLPHLPSALPVPLTRLGELGKPGLVHRDITGKTGGVPRGPFDLIPTPNRTATYPMLWAHEAGRERHLVVEPDSEGRVREGLEDKAHDVWETATRLHFNLDFRLNSQSLAACLTPERAIGGRAWPNFRLDNPVAEEALVLWANTTLGLIAWWWAAGRQQQGRAIITITGLPSLIVLDVRQLSESQLVRAKAIFEEFREREFLPANEAYHDETRQALDRAVLVDLLGLPETILEPLSLLRKQWCSEPSVHGGKTTRPPG